MGRLSPQSESERGGRRNERRGPHAAGSCDICLSVVTGG